MSLPAAVRINEEGPREGFQFEPGPIPTAKKIALIDSLSATGLKQIQIVSFVSPKAVPGMADAEEVVRGYDRRPGVRYAVLWLNEKGLRRAIATGRLDLVPAISASGSEAFLRRNQNRSAEQHLQDQRAALALYREFGLPLGHCGVMAAFGCNFAGEVAPATVVDLISQLKAVATEQAVRLHSATLADTMAWATPTAIKRVVGAVREAHPELDLTLHLHDTRGMGIANAYAGLEMGVACYDAAVAGLGGCPFGGHRGAAGNVCTEDLVFLCEEMGIDTGIDLDALIEAALLAENVVGHPLPGSIMRGGSLKRLREQVRTARAA
jgi:hydroxymethylglutaryl-CoA lyase